MTEVVGEVTPTPTPVELKSTAEEGLLDLGMVDTFKIVLPFFVADAFAQTYMRRHNRHNMMPTPTVVHEPAPAPSGGSELAQIGVAGGPSLIIAAVILAKRFNMLRKSNTNQSRQPELSQ